MNRQLLNLDLVSDLSSVPVKKISRKKRTPPVNVNHSKDGVLNGATMSIDQIVKHKDKLEESGFKTKREIKEEVIRLLSEKWEKYRYNKRIYS